MNEFSKDDLERKITLKIGEKAPNFSLKNGDGVEISLRDFDKKIVVLYFYPKDNTPGCTAEACEFSEIYSEFSHQNAVIIGISPDSVKSHANFISKFHLNHILLSDENREICKLYGVWQVKKNYGKSYLGVVRSTFIIDTNGKIAKIYRSVRAKDHANKVLNDISAIFSPNKKVIS